MTAEVGQRRSLQIVLFIASCNSTTGGGHQISECAAPSTVAMYSGLMGPSDDLLNSPSYVGPGDTTNFRCKAACRSVLAVIPAATPTL